MKAKRVAGIALATAAAGLFAVTAVGAAAAEKDAKIQCEGVNACKGKGDCSTSKNSCQGKNACKGMGMMMMSKADCDKAMAKMKAEKGEAKKEGK